MATSSQPASLPDEGPPYRSFKELSSDPTTAVVFSPAAKRLFWPLDSVFPTALSVMKTPRSAGDLEPYFQQTPSGGIWHEIAQLPLTEPKVSSIEVSVYDLEQWESHWVAWHGCHEGEPADPEYVTYGDLSDEDRPYAREAKEDGSWEEDSDTEFLIRCCGQDRPLRKRGRKLVVTPAAGCDFVTVSDYVSAVHPWLMRLRPEILLAKTVAQPQPYPGAAGMAWMVEGGPDLKVEERQSWIQAHGGGPPRPMPASTAAILERILIDPRYIRGSVGFSREATADFIGDKMHIWTKQPGYPVFTVTEATEDEPGRVAGLQIPEDRFMSIAGAEPHASDNIYGRRRGIRSDGEIEMIDVNAKELRLHTSDSSFLKVYSPS